jgi:hypothetical protein
MESLDALRSVRNTYYLGLYADVAKEVAQLDKHNKEAQRQSHAAESERADRIGPTSD